MNRNDDLKRKVLDELSNEAKNDVILQSILKEDTKDILGEEFTRSVIKAAKTTKKTSPIICLTRVALPFAACAAAVLIFASVGLKDNDNSPLPKDFDTAKVEGDMVISEDPYKSNSDDFDIIPTDNPDEKAPATADIPLEEGSDNAESNNMPSSSASSSQKLEQSDTQSTEKLYTLNLEASQKTVTVFSPAVDSENTSEEITIKVSDAYYGKAIFGYTIYLSFDGEEYEVIVTPEKEISKSELLNQINAYTANICSMMNNANGTNDWQIEIVSEDLPSTIEPNTQIKITRTK